MTKQMIEVEGLPEGYEATSVKINNNRITQCFSDMQATVHVRKIKPREIRLVETDEDSNGSQQVFNIGNTSFSTYSRRVWELVKETDTPLDNEDPKLGLSVCECNGLFEGNQPTINKVKDFIKENS